MLCVDLKNSFYQLPDVHRGLYDVEDNSTNEENLSSSKKIQIVQEEKIPCNEFLSDLSNEEQLIGKLFLLQFVIYTFNDNNFII